MTDVILADAEAERQRGLLLGLQVALNGLGIQAVLARNHHLGLPTEYVPVSAVSGLKPPTLHVFAGVLGMIRVQVHVSKKSDDESGEESFALTTGQSFPAGDAGRAADEIRRLAGLGLSRAGSSSGIRGEV
jgi:hypothetical protein